MKISTKSWHYRMMNSMNMSIPRSLCPYFWKVVFTIGIFSLITALTTLVCYEFGAKALLRWFEYDANAIVAILFGFTLVVGTIMSVFGTVFGLVYAQDKGVFTIKSENIAINYIRAKKSKICPTLEFDYDN